MDPVLSKLLAALREALPECLAIYRFGSWGTADQRPDSDIDLAVLPGAPLPPVQRWELAQKLAVITGRDVDLIDLLAASTELCLQVVAHGTRLYCPDEAEVEKFEDTVFAGYARLNEERRDILDDIRHRGNVHGP